MALKIANRVRETTTTTGTGTYDLGGAVSSFQTFVAGIGDGNTTYYAVIHRSEAEFEVGLGTVTDASTDTLARTSVLFSSNSNSAVSFSAGTKDVFVIVPAEKQPFLDASDNLTIGTGASGTDYALTFDGESADGVITWKEDEDYFEFSDDILLATTEKLQFRDTAIYINSSADGQLDLVADTEIQIAATTIDINGAVDISGNLTVNGTLDLADGNFTNVGSLQLDSIAGDGDTNTSITFSGSDVITITAGGDAQFTFNNGSIVPSTDNDIDLGTSSLEFKDAFFDGTVTTDALVADTADINGGTVDGAIIGGNSAAAITGTAITGTSFVIGSADINETELETIDGVTAGTVAASKAVVVDSSKDISSFRNVTLTGELDAATLDISGDADIDGTANLDNTDIDGTLVVDGSNISLDSTSTLNIDNSNTSNGITIGTATSGVPISIGHTTSETTVNDNLTVTGDLTVSGTTTTVNSTTVNLNDHNLVLDSGNTTSAVVNGGGITIEGGSGDDATFSYNTTGPKFELKLGSSHEDLQVDQLIAASLDISGNVDVDGTLEADAITVDGTALATLIAATTVTNATNSAHVSVADNESTNENNLIPFIEDTSATGNVGLESDGDFTYNPSTGRLTATQLAGTLQTAAQANITSLGTLTTLTVDNVIINGTTIGHTDDTDLITVADGIATVAGEISVTTLDIGGTNVTSTAAELNILDGVTSTAAEINLLDGGTSVGGSITLADGDGIVTNDGGTMKTIPASDIKTYVGAGAGAFAIANLDIDGGTDIGANLADADLFVVDDGAGGTNRKMAASRIATYVGASAGAFSIANLDIDGGTDIGAALTTSDLIVVDDGAGGTNRKAALSRLITLIDSESSAATKGFAVAMAIAL